MSSVSMRTSAVVKSFSGAFSIKVSKVLCAVMLCLKYLQNYSQFQILFVLFFIRHMKRQQQVKLLRKAELFLKKYVFSLYKKTSFCKIITIKS